MRAERRTPTARTLRLRLPAILVVLALWGFAQVLVASADASLPAPVSPLEERLFAEAARGRLDEFSPLAAALVASGVADTDTLRRYEAGAARLAAELRGCQSPGAGLRQQLEATLEFMHRRILRRYELGVNRPVPHVGRRSLQLP